MSIHQISTVAGDDIRHDAMGQNTASSDLHAKELGHVTVRGAPCVEGPRVEIALLKRYIDADDVPEYLTDLFELNVEKIRRAVLLYESPKLGGYGAPTGC